MCSKNFKSAILFSFLLITNVANAAKVKEIKKSSSNVFKVLLSGTGISAIVIGSKYLYDNKIRTDSYKLPSDWEKDILLSNACMSYKYAERVKLNGKSVDINGKYKCFFDKNSMNEEGIPKKPEVIEVYNALYKLYVELSNNEKVKKMKCNPDLYPNPHRDEDEMRSRKIINSMTRFIGTTHIVEDNGVLKWDMKTDFKGVPPISCDMLDNRKYEYTNEIKDDYGCLVKYKATFEKRNGKLNFEKVEFLN